MAGSVGRVSTRRMPGRCTQASDSEYHWLSSSLPARGAVQRACRRVVAAGFEHQPGGAIFARELCGGIEQRARRRRCDAPRSATKRSLRIQIRAVRTDENIGYSWVNPTAASSRIGEQDHRFVAPQAFAQEVARARQVAGLLVELPIGVEQWCELRRGRPVRRGVSRDSGASARQAGVVMRVASTAPVRRPGARWPGVRPAHRGCRRARSAGRTASG